MKYTSSEANKLLKEKNAELEVKLAQKDIEHSEDINNNKSSNNYHSVVFDNLYCIVI